MDEFRKLKDQVYITSKNGFYVRAKKSENLGTRQNVEYVLRYCGRPAFSASKILNLDGEYITFWYQRHKDDIFVVETIHIFEFIKRIIIHIPEYQFKTIRYYGFYSKKSKFNDKMIMFVHLTKIEFARKFNKWFLLSIKTFKDSPLICSKCKTIENIPTEVVEMLDEADCIGVDLSEPPKFNCEKCPGKMVPIYYISVNGRTNEYKQK